MKEIKGFQQPDPKGNDMLKTAEGPWKIYKRGPSYRIGRKAWWGVKWLKERGTKSGRWELFTYQTDQLGSARTELEKVNAQAYDKKWYKDDKWGEIKK